MAVVTRARGRPGGAAAVQRFMLVIGANAAGADRPKLQYAVSDAERFARVLVELGGVCRTNEIVLKQPTLQELIAALDLLHARVSDARRGSSAPGARRCSSTTRVTPTNRACCSATTATRTARSATRLDQIPADVRIAVLDACASGAFTRIKSGRARPAFLVDESADMRGTRVPDIERGDGGGAGIGPHPRLVLHALSRLRLPRRRGYVRRREGHVERGLSVRIQETLGRTVDTKSGPQHPSYDISLSGTGDVVMTDVRQTSATLVLPGDLEGPFFVRNAARELVVELYKPLGRAGGARRRAGQLRSAGRDPEVVAGREGQRARGRQVRARAAAVRPCRRRGDAAPRRRERPAVRRRRPQSRRAQFRHMARGRHVDRPSPPGSTRAISWPARSTPAMSTSGSP